MRHCSEHTLDNLLRDQIDLPDRLVCLLHLALCPPCREKFRQMRNDEKFIAFLRESVILMDNADFDAQRLVKNGSLNIK